MKAILKTVKLFLILVFTLALAACAKRQTSTRLVYIPSPPPAPQSASQNPGGVVLIQEPPPPQHSTPAPRHERKPPAAAAQSKPPAAEQPQPVHTDANAKTPEPELPSAPASATPQLEPLSTVHQKATLQQQINSLKSVVELRIGRLNHLDLSGEDRKALEDARNFLAQSDTATKQGDLQQSLNLAQKADLLVAAVEKKH